VAPPRSPTPRQHTSHNPPGNNGTIKVDGQAYDNGQPNNEPHVDCKFKIDFYGFDTGDLYAQVTFNAQEPTAKGTQFLTDKVFIGEDDQSGGGSQAGLDAHKEYDLGKALAGFTPQPQQGYHVKLTINADASQGSDVKHKTFWVDGCGQETKPENKPAVLPDGNDPLGPSELPTKTGSKTEVKGVTLARPDAELPHTGVETLPLARLGFALLGAGLMARCSAMAAVGRVDETLQP
jgi:hypothetical protein